MVAVAKISRNTSLSGVTVLHQRMASFLWSLNRKENFMLKLYSRVSLGRKDQIGCDRCDGGCVGVLHHLSKTQE